ncbi:MAG: excinuclease ABC subunit UvrC [Verrucomicrobiaceae bacterium]|nr:excinuclease ABC subunit UvrC [Verrucomicrobiaceae bacterium]
MGTPQQKPDLQARLRDVPHQPGVYVMRDRLNRVIYVGKARDLKKRLGNYFQPSRARRVDTKTRALIESIWDFDLHLTRNEPEALLLEGKLIKEFRPRYNISFRDDKRFLLVRLQMADAFPKFSLTRLKKDDGARYYGPFAHSGALRTTLNWLNKHFGLRVCRPTNPGEDDYRHCSNDIIKNCAAPCIGRISAEDYKRRVDEACEFLSGKNKDLVDALEEEMKKAAARMDFERAAELRDMIEDLRKTLKPARRFERGARARVVSTIDPMADVKELQEILHLERPPLVMECFDIANIGQTHCVASMVRFRNGVPDNSNYRRYRIRAVTGQNDFVSMAEVVRRRYSRILLEGRERMGEDAADVTQENVIDAMRRLESDENEEPTEDVYDEVEMEDGSVTANRPAPPQSRHEERRGTVISRPFVRLPDLIIVDGGKGQLGVAVEELQRLGLGGLPIIGLAKEREEVFRPGESEPILIPHERGALRLLQRIRDEAHRWANGYHQLLLRRRVEESLLDDCPGISETRKTALLKTFGSMARLRKATAEQISAIPGIGKGLAEELVRFLESCR